MPGSSRGTTVRILLACGIGYAAVYAVANDLVAAGMYGGYSRVDQAISELSATNAPSRGFLAAMLPVFTLLLVAFGLGVRRAGAGSRALRATGAILIAQGALFPLWLLAPMTSREEMTPGATPAHDVAHLVLTAAAILFILLEFGFGAAALGKRFRVFTVVLAAMVLVFGALTGMQAPKVAAGERTPWMGLFERISYGSWLLWLTVLAVALLRTRGPRAEGERPMLGSAGLASRAPDG